MSEIPKKYNIDYAKNDIQNLQDQNKYDFQEIKRLERELKKLNDELHLYLKIYNIKDNEINQTGITPLINSIIQLRENLTNINLLLSNLEALVDDNSQAITDLNNRLTELENNQDKQDNTVVNKL